MHAAPHATGKTRRLATAFRALCIGTEKRLAENTGAGPLDPDFQTGPATLTRLDKGNFLLVSPGAIAAAATVEVSVTIADAILSTVLSGGATQSDLVHVNAPASLEAGLTVGTARITAPNTITFRVTNSSGGPITPATATYQYFLVRS